MILASRRRSALTLIELIVVLVILVGLAGILIPILPSMLGRTHTAAGATNMQEMVKWIQVYEQLYLRFPDEWDSLTDGANLVSYLPNDGGSPSGGQIVLHTLTADEAAALKSLGIHNVHHFSTTLGSGQSPTFNPYAAAVTAPTAIAANVKVAAITAAAANEKLGLDINGTYLVFGLGKRCTMVGRTVTDPPIVSADEDAINPASYYGRFLIVVKVAQGTTTLPKAAFVGVVSMHPDQIDGAGQHLEEYYEITKNAK